MKRKAIQAFTLVEVALALAITSFGIVAVLGLLPGGLTAARNAADSTITATIVQDMFSALRQQSFNNTLTWGSSTFTLTNANTGTFNFDPNGISTNSVSYYQVILQSTPDTTISKSFVQATVVWPAKAAVPMNTNVYTTTIAKYR